MGKTAFCQTISNKGFPTDYKPTVGSDYFMKNHRTSIGQCQFNFWDLSGEDQFLEVRNEFYKESQAMLIFFDLTRKATFVSLEEWIREGAKNITDVIPVFIVGTKMDLDKKR